MAERYQFQYYPVTGKLTGNQMIRQTEQAINELAQNVYEGSAQVEVINTIVNQAEQNAEQALEKATQALESAGRVYIDELTAVNLNNYYNSELLYIGDETSENLPVVDTGFLEVKTNDSMTNAAQVFIADSSGLLYFRQATIIPQEVGSVTTYDVTWGTWFTYATQEYVSNNYLSLTGGNITGDLSVSGTISGNLTGNVTGTASGNLSLSGGTMTNAINMNDKALNLGTGNDDDGRIYNISNLLRIVGGSNTSTGSYIDIGSSSATVKGIVLAASDGNGTTKQLKAVYDGTLTWDGNAVALSKDVLPYAVQLYKSDTGATVGETVTLSQNTSRFPAFLICVSADINEGYGNTIGIFCGRFGNALNGGTVRGMNGLDFNTTTTAFDLRTVSVGLSFSGTSCTIANAAMTRYNGSWTKYARHVYAIYGLNFVIQ